jgi:hypothetical protein
MVALIQELRDMSNSGTTDYSVNTINYFSDDQLQTYLDRTRLLTRMMPMQPVPVRVGATTQWLDYQIPDDLGNWFEQYVDPTSGWAVKDGNGNTKVLGADYTVNYDAALVTFTADTLGQAYLIDCRSYDLFAAAAAVWRKKASFEARAVDFRSDNHDIKASQRREYCLKMADYYEQKSGVSGEGGIGTGTFMRTDEDLSRPNYSQGTDQETLLGGVTVLTDSETSLRS